MKTVISLILFCALWLNLTAQAPQKMSYQAIVRNTSGALVTNQPVGIKVSILQGSATGTVVFSEMYSPNPVTNTNGLVSLEIGSGIPLAGTFAGINWADGLFYLKTETDPSGGTNYTIIGTSQLLSVPFALYAKNVQNNNDADADATNEIQTLSITGKNLSLSKGGGNVTIPGDNWGAQEVVADATIGGSGTAASPLRIAQQGAASGQVLKWSGTVWLPGTDLSGSGQLADADGDTRIVPELYPDDDTLRFYTKGVDRLRITPSGSFETFGDYRSLRLGFKAGISSTGDQNTFIGDSTGFKNTTGWRNTAVGYAALRSNTNGIYNTAVGNQALYSNSSGYNNSAVGDKALFSNTSGAYNTAHGIEALQSNSTGSYNTAHGYQALCSNTAFSNTAYGYRALFSNTDGYNNTAIGYRALNSNTLGYVNTAVGYQALYSNTEGDSLTAIGNRALRSNTTGMGNTAVGNGALYSNTTGYKNTAVGHLALFTNTGSWMNTAIGYQALFSNSTYGNFSTALGYQALYSNIGGFENTALGFQTLYKNTEGYLNTAIGNQALYSNTTGHLNIANGYRALYSNVSGRYNTGIGFEALFANTTGTENTATGYEALHSNTSGFYNTAHGSGALQGNTTGLGNTAVGEGALQNSNGDFNTALGRWAGVTSSGLVNTTAIGFNAKVNASNKIVLGNADAKTVGGYGAWTNYSDKRLKENIVYRNEPGLNFILLLKPVSFNYIDDTNKRRRDGLIAQDVQQALEALGVEFSGLIIDDDPVKTMNLSYTEFVIPLINAVRELKVENDLLKSENGQHQTRIETLESRLSRLESLLESISER